MTSSGGPGGGPMVSQHCIDAKTDDLMQQRTQGMGKQECSKNSVRREGGKTIAESVCKFGETTATTRAVFSGDFSSNYRGDIQSTYSPPMMGMKEAKQTLEAKWLGACKGRPETRRRDHARYARRREVQHGRDDEEDAEMVGAVVVPAQLGVYFPQLWRKLGFVREGNESDGLFVKRVIGFSSFA